MTAREQALRESEERLRKLNASLEQKVLERTKELESGTVTLSSFTYTLTFAGFSGPYITITGP